MAEKEKCRKCADGIPTRDGRPTPCPKCGRAVAAGMVAQYNKSGHLVWDYPRARELPAEWH